MRITEHLAMLIALSTLLLFSFSSADDTKPPARPVPEIPAFRIQGEAPVIDGNPDEAIWKSPGVICARNFTKLTPDEGKPASESTVVAVLYDEQALYFALWCYDSEPDKIKKQLDRRDRTPEADYIVVKLDPYFDHQTGYSFSLNASGVQQDSRLYNDTWLDTQWDAVWDGAVKMQPWGWSAELKIPYYCLRFSPKEEQTWGLNFSRYISRKNESNRWSFSPSSEGGLVSRFGHLTGLKGIKPVRHMEVLPYMVANAELTPKTIGNADGRDYAGNTGLDIKYSLATNMTLDATINPDFGQVELDAPVLNLSSFETFYSEKRPFFLEGSNLFDTQFQLFYSRRIGRSPAGSIRDNEFAYYTQWPKSTTILGASKLTGKLSGGTTIAFLNAVTDAEKASYAAVHPVIDLQSGDTTAVDTVIRKGEVEAQADYSVLRIQQDIFSSSNVGLIMTMVGQDHKYPAKTGGMDWRLTTKNAVWGFSGQTVFSRVDNYHTGFGVSSSLSKDAGRHIRGEIGMNIRDPYLNLNRLGYLDRNDFRDGWVWLQYRTQDGKGIIRNTWNNVNCYAGWNYAKADIEKGWNFNSNIDFKNNWSLSYGISQDVYRYEDRETRGNGLWERPHSWNWWASLSTDSRKFISANINPGSGKSRNGTWWANYIGFTLHPQSNLQFSAGTNYERYFHMTRWVDNQTDTITSQYVPLFADLDEDQITIDLSASVLFTRNLSWQISGEGYIAGLDYNNVRRYIGNNQYAPLGDIPLSNYSRNSSALNSTMILRWEFQPGSTLYFVWTRAWGGDDGTVDDLNFSRDMKRLFTAGADNVWLVKASYWWNL